MKSIPETRQQFTHDSLQPCLTCRQLREKNLLLKGAIAQARQAAEHWRQSAHWATKARLCEDGEGRA